MRPFKRDIEQYFPVMLFVMVLTFKSEDETLKCDHSNESYRAVLSCLVFVMLHKVALTEPG